LSNAVYLSARPQENPTKHRFGKFAGQGILLAGMVRGYHQRQWRREPVFAVVGERIRGTRGDLLAAPENVEVRVVRQLAQGNDDAEVGQQLHFLLQVRAAPGKLLRRGLVARRCATDRRRDIEICEPEAVVARNRVGLGGKAGLVQHPVEEVPGGVPGEHAAGAVGAVGPWGQSDEQHPGVWVPERGNREAPIWVVLKSTALLVSYETAMVDQSGTLLAADHLLLECGQRVHLPLVPPFAIYGVQ
jgi:hypothetical protein